MMNPSEYDNSLKIISAMFAGVCVFFLTALPRLIQVAYHLVDVERRPFHDAVVIKCVQQLNNRHKVSTMS